MKVYFCGKLMLKAESYTKAIIYSTGINFFAKALYFLNTLVIAYFFGASTSTDIYFFVISIAVLLTTGMLNAVDGIVLIPHAMQLRQTNGDNDSRKFLNFFLWMYILVGLVISLIALLSPIIFYNIFSKFSTDALALNTGLLYAGAALIFFQLVNNFVASILSSYKYFTVTIFTSLITSVSSIIITVLFHKALGIAGTLAAVAASFAISVLFLLGIMKFKLQWHFTKISFVKNKQLWGNIGLMQLNILPIWLRNYVTLFLLTGLGAGIVSSVTLAQQAASAIDTLIIAQVLSVAGIKLNELYAKNNLELFNDFFIKTASFLLIILMPVVVIVFLYTDTVATLIFNRGNFSNTAIETVSLCLKYLILLSPLMFLNSLCTRIFAAAQIVRQGLLYSISAHIIFLLLAVALINWFNLKGYLVAMLLGYGIIIFFFFLLFKSKLPKINFSNVLKFGIMQLLINIIIALPLFFLFKSINGVNNIILLFVAAFAQAVIIFIINRKRLHLSVITNFVKELSTKKNV